MLRWHRKSRTMRLQQTTPTTTRPRSGHYSQKLVADAMAYDTPEKRQAAADAAMADTNMAFGKANEANARTMAANGVNPNSTRSMSVMQGQGVNQAMANAGAAYKARKGVEATGHTLQVDAAGLGKNLPSEATAASNAATLAGNSASSNSINSLNAVNTGVAPVQAAYSAASNASLGLGSLNDKIANTNNQASQASTSSNDALFGSLGSIAGSFVGSDSGSDLIKSWLSDENVKTDIKPMSDEEALAATNATPVKKWKYDPAKLAEQGIPMPEGAGGENVGPMAQDVNKTMGEAAAPGGKTLNPVTMNGIAMKSIQALDKKVNRLAKIIEKGVSA